MKRKVVDILERTFWTGVQASVAYLGTRLVDIGPEWTLVGAPALAVVKGWVATHVGNRESASLTATI